MHETLVEDDEHGSPLDVSYGTDVPGALPGREVHARASSLLCLASFSASIRTAVGLIEPPSTARHSGPPRATGWMTGASSQAATRSANRPPTPRAP